MMKKISNMPINSKHSFIEDCVKTNSRIQFGMLLREGNWGEELIKAVGFMIKKGAIFMN